MTERFFLNVFALSQRIFWLSCAAVCLALIIILKRIKNKKYQENLIFIPHSSSLSLQAGMISALNGYRLQRFLLNISMDYFIKCINVSIKSCTDLFLLKENQSVS